MKNIRIEGQLVQKLEWKQTADDTRMEEFHGSVMRLAFACAAASLIKYPGHGTSNYDTEFRLFCLLLSAFNGEPNQVYM